MYVYVYFFIYICRGCRSVPSGYWTLVANSGLKSLESLQITCQPFKNIAIKDFTSLFSICG